MPENLVPSDLVYAQSGYRVKLDEDIAIVGCRVTGCDAALANLAKALVSTGSSRLTGRGGNGGHHEHET